MKFRNVSGHFTIISLTTYTALYPLMLIGETINPYIPKEVLQDFETEHFVDFFSETKKSMKIEKVF